VPADSRIEPAVRVSTLELFFDLVFVFTITQLTARLAGELSVPGLLRVMLMLGVIWWMYGGYAWLTNAVAPTDALRRALLITGMAGFLAIAVAVPDAFGGSGWIFGLGYFVVNLVHSGLFWHGGGPGAAAALRGLGPLNLASASLVLAGGLLPGVWREVAWTAALAVQIASPYLHPIGGFTVSPAHFVERHGLVVIVALGESVVAIGLGAGGHLSARLLGVAVLGLLLAYCLWWAYFGGDDERAEQALRDMPDGRRRALAAIIGYAYAHYVLLLGIVVLATGVKVVIGHPFEHAGPARAVALGGGTALFFLGDLCFRRALRIGRPGYRAACLVAGLLSIPLGLVLSAAQLAALTAAVALLLAAEGRARNTGEAHATGS
jgi:low temperature requirement protein LtrA